MRKVIFWVVCIFFFLVSCDEIILKVKGKEADLQGKWQMDNADTVYYNFQKSLFMYQIRQKKDHISSAYGYYILHGDTAIDLKLLTEYSSDNLDHLGWDTLYAANRQDTVFKSFKIEKLTNKKLVLSTDGKVVSFHKF
jgi:hypothetical protein